MSDSQIKYHKTETLLFPAQPLNLKHIIEYVDESIVSRTLEKKPAGTVTLFSFDEGQELSEHTAPFNALVQILDGEVELTIGSKVIKAVEGQIVLMPANVPHSLRAIKKFKMLLIMIRE